jgi:hypothetical protein
MDKDSKKKLVGQPIFKQIINIIPKEKFDELALKCGSDKYYKTFFSWEQLVVMLFGIFSRCDSINGIKTQIWCTLIACLLLIVIQTLSKNKKGIFDDSRVDQDTFDKSFGFDLGSNRSAASIQKTPKKQKQKPLRRADVFFLMGGRFLKNKNKVYN